VENEGKEENKFAGTLSALLVPSFVELPINFFDFNEQ